MFLTVAGLASGNPELITPKALRLAKSAEAVIVPRSRPDKEGFAENILLRILPELHVVPVVFPMEYDTSACIDFIAEQLRKLPEVLGAGNVFFPVIGDALLYSTGAHLIDAFRRIGVEVVPEFVAGLSACQLAAMTAGRVLVRGEEILGIIPGTAGVERVRAVMGVSDVVALYKPVALGDGIRDLAGEDWDVVRVDFAGVDGKEKIITGPDALNGIDEYMSVVLLWR